MTYFKHKRNLNSSSLDLYSSLENTSIDFPYGINLVNNSLTQIYKRKGKFKTAMKICSGGIKLSSKWLKTVTKKDMDKIKMVIKVLFTSLILRAQIFRVLKDSEKEKKTLLHARDLVKKYCPEDKELLKKVNFELRYEENLYQKQNTKSSKFSDYINKVYKSSELLDDDLNSDPRNKKTKKKIKIDFSKKKRIRSASTQNKRVREISSSKVKMNQRNNDSSPKFRINRNKNSSNSQEIKRHRISSSKDKRRNKTPNLRIKKNKKRNNNYEKYNSMSFTPQRNSSHATFGNMNQNQYGYPHHPQQHPYSLNHTLNSMNNPYLYSPLFGQQYQESLLLQQKCNTLQELNKTLQLELLKARSGVEGSERHIEHGTTDLRSSNFSKSMNVFDNELIEKIELIKKEQDTMKEVKDEIRQKLDQINKKLDGDILPGIFSPSNISNQIPKSDPESRKTDNKNSVFTSSNSPKSEIIPEESSIKHSSDKNKKNSDGNFDSMGSLNNGYNRKVTLTLGDDLRKRANRPVNHQVATYMIAYDFLTTSYFVYLENCLQKLEKKSNFLRKNQKDNENSSSGNKKGGLKSDKNYIENYWTFGKMKEKDITVKFQYKVVTTSKGFFFEIYAWEYNTENFELGKLLCSEKLNQNQIRYIFQKMKASDVLPTAYPISTFKSIGHFIIFAMNHFVTVEVKKSKKGDKPALKEEFNDSSDMNKTPRTVSFLEENELNLVIKSDIISLTPEIEMTFMGVESKVIFIHLNSNNFRVVIKGNEKNKKNSESQTLDIYFSDSAIRKYFDVNHSNKANKILRSFEKDMKKDEELMSKLSSKKRIFSRKSYFYDEEKDSKSKKNQSMMSIVSGRLANKAIEFGESEVKVLTENKCTGQTGYCVKKNNIAGLVDLVKKFVRGFNEYLDFHKRTLKEVNSLDYYYLLKIIDHKKDQFTIYEAYENDLSPTFKLRARNTFESYSAKEASTFITEMGKFSPNREEIISSLGLEYKDKNIIEKRFIWYIYMRRAVLVFHEKSPDLLLNLLIDDDEQKPNQNSDDSGDNIETLQILPLEVPTGKRFYQRIKDNYVIPITLEIIGLNGDIFGIRASTYDPRNASQSTGFLVLYNLYKNHDSKKFGVKTSKKLWRAKQYHDTYEILLFYDKFGFKTLREQIVKVNDNQPLIKKNRISGSYSSCFHSADHYFDLKQILENYGLDTNLIGA